MTILKTKVTAENTEAYQKFLKRQRSLHNKLLLEAIREAGETGISAEDLEEKVSTALESATEKDIERWLAFDATPSVWVEWIGSYGRYTNNTCSHKFKPYVQVEGAPAKAPRKGVEVKESAPVAEATPEVTPEAAPSVEEAEIAALVESELGQEAVA